MLCPPALVVGVVALFTTHTVLAAPPNTPTPTPNTKTTSQSDVYPLTAPILAKVRANAISSAAHSWEYGTLMQALLELDTPQLAVFEAPSLPPTDSTAKAPKDALGVLNRILDTRRAGVKAFMRDGSSGDPASMGVFAFVSAQQAANKGEAERFTAVAESQLDFLLHDVPRHENGAISHRVSEFQAWADFISMGPPFIAYAGAVQGNASLLQEAYDQIKGYREILRDPKSGLWRHIVFGSWDEPSLWGTGNAWAAHGSLRVIETLRKSADAPKFEKQVKDLTAWVQEILDKSWAFQAPSGAVRNHLDDEESFECGAATALLAASTFRLATITGSSKNIPAATRALNVVADRIDADGWATRIVDPLAFSKEGKESPEAQAFVLMLDAAWKAWDASTKAKTLIGAGAVNVGAVGPGAKVPIAKAASQISVLFKSLARLLVTVSPAQ